MDKFQHAGQVQQSVKAQTTNAKKHNQVQEKEAKQKSVYNITGVAGEYFVAAELSRRGWIATITLKNTPNIRHL